MFASQSSLDEKMAGRPRNFEESELLEKAIDLFWEKGYEATTLENLLDRMDLNKGSLYHFFGSKRDLFIKGLDFFGKRSIQEIESKIQEAGGPIEGIKNFFLDLAGSAHSIHSKGCFMGNTISELAIVDDELKDKAIENLKALENLFYKYIEQAKKAKELATKEDSRMLARYLLTIWNGINITRRMYPSDKILKPLIKMQLAILR